MKAKFYLAIVFSIVFFGVGYAQTVDEDATITWPHNSADDPVASYSNNTGVYFKPDHVSLGSNLSYKGVRTSNGATFRNYQPAAQTGAGAENVVGFNIWPVTGLNFVPTNVSFKAQRYGTDGGLIDVIWKSTNGTETTIATGVKPDRDNSGGYTDVSYDLSGLSIPASDAECTLQLILHSLGNTKEAGFADVVVQGNVSGTIINVTTYTLTTSVVPELAGDITSFPVGNEFDEGTEISLTANKNFGYAFSHWANAADQQVSTENPYVFSLNVNTELKAVFDELNTYALMVLTEGGAADYMVSYSPEGNMVDEKRMYEDGNNVTLTSKNNPIITFTNWSSGETSAELMVTMDGDKEITASYSAVDYIVGWDFYIRGNQGRVADFYSKDENQSSALVIRNEGGSASSWLDKSTEAAGGYEAAEGAAVNWNSIADKYYYQISFNASDFTDIKVAAEMMYNYNAYATQKCEYSLDGTNFTTLGTIELQAAKALFPSEFDLPAEANNAAMVYVRWIPDYNSSIVGSSSEKDGTVISAIYVTATEAIVDDGIAPVLTSSVPVDNATGASASGKIVLTFDEKVKIAENTTASLGSMELTPAVSGKTITFPYVGLDYNAAYTFTLAGNTVSDLTDNTLTDPVVINFTTLDKPTVSKKAYDFIVGTDGDFAAALEAAKAASSTGNRFIIFFPNGEYDLGNTTGDATQQTHIGIPNVSYIGESVEGVILFNNPDPSDEGIGNTPTINFLSSSSDVYMQDLTLLNKMDYRTGEFKGRAVALRDQGDRSIFKNVALKSNQDTYYTGTGRSYWEAGEIHGTVDFIFGGGDVFFNECLIYLEDRSGNHVTAAATSSDWGYVFSNCTIDGFESTNGTYKLGRPWQGAPKVAFLNTTMEVLPAAAGWSEWNVLPAVYAEYNSMTSSGSAVDLSYRRTNYSDGTNSVVLDPVLSQEQAATYTIDNVMGGSDTWQPNLQTEQAPIPVISLDGNKLSWENSDYVLGWAVIINGSFVDFVTTNNYNLPDDKPLQAVVEVRAANAMGGLSDASNQVDYVTTAVDDLIHSAQIVSQQLYTIDGKRLFSLRDADGIVIVKTLYSNGYTSTKKILKFKNR